MRAKVKIVLGMYLVIAQVSTLSPPFFHSRVSHPPELFACPAHVQLLDLLMRRMQLPRDPLTLRVGHPQLVLAMIEHFPELGDLCLGTTFRRFVRQRLAPALLEDGRGRLIAAPTRLGLGLATLRAAAAIPARQFLLVAMIFVPRRGWH